MRAWRTTRSGLDVLACAVLSLATAGAVAQPAPFAQVDVAHNVDSGFVTNPAGDRGVAFTTIVSVPGAVWLRLSFDDAVLGEAPPGGQPTMLVITSLLDGAMQHHRALTLQQWNNTSAYFNGNGVRLEIIADPGAAPSRVALSNVIAGVAAVGNNGICGPTDDRLPSSDPRVGRGAPNGCTAFMISDSSNCFLSAGHCNLNFALVEFNVPLSSPDGILNHPGPEDQYILDQSSVQSANGGIGNDWMYFGCFSNTETGLTAAQAQGAAFDLAASPPPVAGQTIRATGYGTDSAPLHWNQVQQSATGPYFAFFGSTVQHRVDSQPGNSGSPLINDGDGLAIGILTHDGCVDNTGANHGTGSNNAGLQSALLTPQGVCLPAPSLAFAFPDGLPQLIDAPTTIRVDVTGTNGGTPQPGSGLLHYDADGGGFVAVPMPEVEPNVYDATFPGLQCFLPVRYYFSAETTTGEVVSAPLLAPGQHFVAVVASGQQHAQLLADDAQVTDNFGVSVGVSGDVALVGAWFADDNGLFSGSAYVFRHEGSSWVQEEKLLASDGDPSDHFGYAVAVSGDTVVVGAPGDDDVAFGAGAAYVFRHNGSTWTQEQKLLVPEFRAQHHFGAAVAISGNVIIVGAYGGRLAHVFRDNGAAWIQEQKLLASDADGTGAFGYSVAIDGDAAIIGDNGDGDNGDNSGSAYVFRYDGTDWVQEQKLLAPDGAEGDTFGYSVSLSGDVALVSAAGDDDRGVDAGAAYEFRHKGSTWSPEQKLLASDGAAADRFGASVAVDGGRAVIGADRADDVASSSGAAYVFRLSGSTWVQTEKLHSPTAAEEDRFGNAVAVDREVVLVGAWHDDDAGALNAGSAEVFQTLCSTCAHDLDGDGHVGIGEFLALLIAWGTDPGGPPDFDGDGTVGQPDLEALLAAWGPCG